MKLAVPTLLHAYAPGCVSTNVPTLNTRRTDRRKKTTTLFGNSSSRDRSESSPGSRSNIDIQQYVTKPSNAPQPQRQKQREDTHALPKHVECTHRPTPGPARSRIPSQAPGSRPTGHLSTCSRPQAIAQGSTCIFEKARDDTNSTRVRSRHTTIRSWPFVSPTPVSAASALWR